MHQGEDVQTTCTPESPGRILPKAFGHLVNAEYVVAQSQESMGLAGEHDALVVVDRATDYKDCYPLLSRHSDDAEGALRDYFGENLPRRMCTDNAPELIKACREIKVVHGRSTPHRHQSNA